MSSSSAVKRLFISVLLITLIASTTLYMYGNDLKRGSLATHYQLQSQEATESSEHTEPFPATSENTEPSSTLDDAGNATASNISIFVESFDQLNAFYGNMFAKSEKSIPGSCPLPGGGTCTIHHSTAAAKTSDVVFRMVRFIHSGDTVRYHEGQLIAVLNSEADRGEYGLQQLKVADIRIDHHFSSDTQFAEICSLPVAMWESSPPPDPSQRKGIAIVTSNCGVQWRSNYIVELMKYIHIDSYGYCWHNTDIKVSNASIPVPVDVASKYRLYVTFENTIEDDYITEKIVFAYKAGAIPVYWGPPQIYSWVPGNHTFIDASQYSPEELAKYLKRVVEKDDLYLYHMSNFDIVKTKERIARLCPKDSLMCEVCKIAHRKLQMR